MTGLLDDIAPPSFQKFQRGKRCPNCDRKYNTWIGFVRHCANCVDKKGIAFNYLLGLIGFAVLTILYVTLSIPVDWVYDIIYNNWMLPNTHIFAAERIETLQWMTSVWAFIPFIILFSFFYYMIVRTLREKAGGY